MKYKLLPFVIALAAIAVSASAAFYSVFGLSKLFAGASTQVIIMASSLEFAKLVVASLLYQYWNDINKILRIYLSISVGILMLITSGGIYGYLSGAYQETSTKSEYLDQRVMIIEQKRSRFEEHRVDLKESIIKWSTALSNPTTIQYVDKETGQLVTTTSSRQRNLLESKLESAEIRLNMVTDSIASLDIQALNQQIGNDAARELGPLKYLSQLLDTSMDKIINIFLLLIIFVFDPLAIALVISANFAFSKLQYSNKSTAEMGHCSVPDGAEFDTLYPIPEEDPVNIEDQDFIALENYITGDISPLNEMRRSDLDQLQTNTSSSLHEGEDIKKNILATPKRSGGYWF